MAFTKINAAGIGSTETVTLDGLTVINDGSFGGNVSVGGTLTYEDVTNIDSVGLITARSGVEIGASPGVAASISADGNAIFSGITTVGGNADIEGALVVGNGVAAPLSGFSAHFHADATSNKIQITTSNTGVTNADGAIIMVDSGSNMEILNRENSNIEFFTNNSQRMTLDSSGRLLLGTTTEGHAAADDFTISNTDADMGLTLRSGTSYQGAIYFSDGTSGDAEYKGIITYNHANDKLSVYTNASAALHIDSSGRLLLGTTTEGTSNADDLTIATSGHTGLTIRSGTSNQGNIFFSDGTSGADEYRGYLQYEHTANTLIFGTDGSERFRIDSAGDLGLGVTPDNFGSFRTLHIKGPSNEGAAIRLQYNTDVVDSNDFIIYKHDSAAYLRIQGTDPLVAFLNGAERLRIDSSGRLLIGTTETSSNQSGALNVFGNSGDTAYVSIRRHSDNASGPRLALCKSRGTTDGSFSGGTVQSGDILGTIHFYGNDSQGFEEGAAIQALIDASPGSNDLPTRLSFQTTPDGSDTKIERMRVSSHGAVSIGDYNMDGKYFNVAEPNVTDGHSIYLRAGTSSSYSNNRVLNCDLHGFYRQSYGQTGFRFRNKDSVSNNRSARVHLYQNDDDQEVGSIMIGASGTAFNTSSDYRLKENEVLISDGITRLKQLKPYRFNFKATPSETVDGFFAHEVSPVVPNAVTGEKDAMVPNAWYQEGDTIPSGKSVGDVKGYSSTEMEIQSLDYAKITPLLTAALQEAIAKIETLEAKIAALEG